MLCIITFTALNQCRIHMCEYRQQNKILHMLGCYIRANLFAIDGINVKFSKMFIIHKASKSREMIFLMAGCQFAFQFT